MFTRMLRELYNSLFEELEHIEDVAEAISAEIFKGKQRAMVVKISETTRTLLSFKRTTDMHHEVLEALRERGAAIFGDNWDREMEAVLLDYQKINATIRANLELLREFRETNNSLLSAKQNEVVKRFTVIGSVLFVISILVTIFLELR
jgi:Mg2+ and Co2+ transporter CorA